MKIKSTSLGRFLLPFMLVCVQAVELSPVFAARLIQQSLREQKLFKGKVSATVAKGEKLLLSGKYVEAQDVFNQAINQNSKDYYALCGMGFALAMQFKLDAADAKFSKALAVNSKAALAHVGKALSKLNRLQSSSMTIIKQRQSMLSQAESECRFALKAEPNMPEAHIVLGMVLKEQGRLDEAGNELLAATKSDKNYSAAYAQLGLVQLAQNKVAEATQSFKQALSIKTNNSTAHYGLGLVFLNQGDLDSALRELNIALYQNRNSAPTHTALGDCYRLQGNLNAAIKEYKEAIRIKAESESAYLHLADIRETRGDLELAISELRSGLVISPGSVDLHRRVAELSLKLMKLDDALNEFNNTLSLQPTDPAAIKGLIRTYYLKTMKEANGAFFVNNNYESAEKMIQQAIKLNPNDMELRLAEAKLRALSGKQVDLSQVPRPTNDAQRIAYAEALLADHKYQEASEQMAIAINNCANAEDTFAVADMALLIRDLDSADMAYKKAATFADAKERAERGMDLVAKQRDSARQDLTFADDLARKKQLPSAIDKYRQAAYENPRLSAAQLGLAEALKKLFPNNPASLREAALHFRAYVSLEPNLPEKERNKFEKTAEKLTEKAEKLELKQAKKKKK